MNFFISRAGPDAKWAKWIAKCLREAGYSVVLQDWDFRPGQDFVAEMDRAMRDADRTIAVLSRHYDKALFTVPEWTNAVAQDPTGRHARLLPVRVDDIVPEGIFRTRIFIDLVGLNDSDARQALLDGVRRASVREAGEVPFPGGVTARFQGALPPLWRLPSDRNPVFTGREVEFNQIRASFEAADPPPLVVALVGMGGVGKTALAIEYANRQRDAYKVVWWVRAERRETVFADLALLADRLELTGDDDDLDAKAAAARAWLTDHNQWLLLLDEAEDATLARLAIPAGGGGHVLVTSRGPAWRRHGAVIELAPLLEESAVDLLARRSGRPRDSAAAKLVTVLGGLPLALELAGAFLEQQGLEVSEYLDRLRRRGGLPVDDPSYRPPDYGHGLQSVWAESFRVLGDQSPLATDLLRLAAFFAPDDIPRPALVRGQSSLPSGLGEAAGDADQLADLVARPRAFSLVSTSGDGFSMHRLVQAVLRDGLERSEVERWAGTAVLLLDQVLPKQVSDVRLWSRTGRLVGHALTAAGHGVEQLVEPAATIRLLDRGATYLSATGGAPEDVAAMRLDALRLGEALPDGPPAWLLNNHGTWLVEQGALDEAQGMLERAVRATRRAEGGNSAELGTHWVNLGGLAQRRGELERARTYLQRGLAILDTLPEWADAQRATGHSLLGQVLFQEGDWDAAASHFAEAVRGYDAALGPTSQDSLLARTFLAQALGEDPRRVVTSGIMTASSIAAEEGRLLTAEPAWLDEAERLLRDAWESGEPGAAVELASLLRSQPGREAEGAAILAEAAERGDSEALYWHARDLAGEIGAGAESEIRRSIKAGNVFSWYDLGLVLASDENRRPEAEAAFRAALDGKFEIARNDLGILLLSWPGRESEGEAMLEEAGRRGHPRSWFNLGQYRWKTPGREHEAEGPLRRAAHAGYLRAYGSLAYLLEELNRLDESLAAFTEGLEAGEDALGPHLAEFLDRHPELEADSN